MARKQLHNNFVEYMQFIANHETYQGMPDLYKDDGGIQWETPSNRKSGKFKDSHKKRLGWWRRKAAEVGIDINSAQWISRTAKLIHPTKVKPCSVCGREMDLRYAYPTALLLSRISKLRYVDETFELDLNEHIRGLLTRSVSTYGDQVFADLPRLLKAKGITIPSLPAVFDDWLQWIEEVYIPSEPSMLSPGAMSNAPDRLDGFHTYNRCCRPDEDKGRSALNLKTYSTDRRVFEFWNQGDWIAADRLVGLIRSSLQEETCLNGHPGPCTADHIGPLSLGFNHRPEFQLLCTACNSAKNNRMALRDVVHLREVEAAGESVISWHSKALWNARKLDVIDEETALRLSKLLRDNRHNVLHILRRIAEKDRFTFLATYLELEYADNNVAFENLRVVNHITQFDRMIRTPRTTLYTTEQKVRRFRIAFSYLFMYFKIESRNAFIVNSEEIEERIERALYALENSPKRVKSLDEQIQEKLLLQDAGEVDNALRSIVDLIPGQDSEPESFRAAKYELAEAICLIATELSNKWEDDRYVRTTQRVEDLDL